MTGRPIKHSLSLRGHRTSVSLEEAFWNEFRAIAKAEGKALNAAPLGGDVRVSTNEGAIVSGTSTDQNTVTLRR